MTQLLRSSNIKYSHSFLPRQVFHLVSLLFAAIFATGAFALPNAAPKISFVTPLGAGAKTGTSWGNASSDLQAMIDASVSGDEVWVAGGTYIVPSSSNGFTLKEGVKVYGGFAGTEGVLANRNLSLTANKSILSADGIKNAVIGNSSALTTATRLDGFTITGAKQSGIANTSSSSPTLVNLKINGNASGGVLNMDSSSPILINCAIVDNGSAGILNLTSSPVIINCTIVVSASSSFGVGIFNTSQSSPKVRNSILSASNTAFQNDGGSSMDIQYSLVYSRTGGFIYGYPAITQAEPLFSNPASGDYTLQHCSPGVNNGSNTVYAGGQIPDISNITTDLEGHSRFFGGGTVDMGAYEHQQERAGTPGVKYVKSGGTGNGASWDCAMGSLQQAIASTLNGQIWVAGGTYLAEQAAFTTRGGVNVYGGFAGTETSLAERDLSITSNKSILRRTGDNFVVEFSGQSSPTPVLDGFTISGGNVGVFNFAGASPMLVNLVFTGLSLYGIANSGGAPVLINCAIINNIGTSAFAAVANTNASPVLINCTIAGNSAPGGSSIGIYNSGSSAPKLRNSIIYGNQNGMVNAVGATGTTTIEYSIVESNKTISPVNPPVPDIDPLFVNAAGGDYRLQPCSPAINKGFNYYASGQAPDFSGISTDLHSNPRLAESAVDMGAYEFSGASRALAVDGDEAVGDVNGDFLLTSDKVGCRLLAYVSPNRTAPLSGDTKAKVWVATDQPSNYLKRHYQIQPATNGRNATAKVTLYFTQQEFTAFNVASPIKLPLNAADVEGYKANLRVEKRSGISDTPYGLPSSYAGTIETITPSSANGGVAWNADASRWEVSFDVTGFSGFFVKTIQTALPLNLISFTATHEVGSNLLQWSTTSEVNTDHFEVQSSSDAKNFIKVATIKAAGTGNFHYRYLDRTNYGGTVYYRLKMSDQDDTFTYSKLISLKSNGEAAVIYPNPAGGLVTFQVSDALLKSTANLFDIAGRRIQSVIITRNQQQINTTALASGIYILKFADGTAERFVKE